MKKGALLFLGLVLPVLVFIFLKFFGRNEFEVPLLYANEVPEAPSVCKEQYSVPYRVNASVLKQLSGASSPALLAVDFAATPIRREFNFQPDEFHTVNAETMINDSAAREYVRTCVMLMKDPATIVLIDSSRHIRGYYNANDRDDLDRMNDEVAIILKKY